MNSIKIFLVAFCVINFLIFAQDSDYKTKKFNVAKGGNLNVSLSVGDISITPWEKDEVEVKYEVNEDENEYANQVKISKNGNNIEITSAADYNDEIIISIPSRFNVELKTYAGDVKINGKISGKIEIKTSGGDISTQNIEGTTDLSTAGGDIKTGEIKGNISVSSAGGDLQLGNITGIADIKTAGGNIKMQNISSNAEVKTAGGNILIENVGGTAEVKSGGGNISVGNVSRDAELKTGGGNISLKSAIGKVDAKTGAGNISLKNITGSVQAATGAGEIYVELIPDNKFPSDIKSNMGNIRFFIPSNAKATINAESRGGWNSIKESEIKSDFKASTSNSTNDKTNKKYILNGGGINISLETTSGNISIRSLTK